MKPENTLYYGDNLDVLRRHVADESVDLVYLDPPFNSGRNYNILFDEKDGTASASQIQAFGDTWHWDQTTPVLYASMVEQGGGLSRTLQGLRLFLGTNDMMAYLVMMAARLVELRRALKPTGSIYLHCDPTASHYLKILMDAVFGRENFRNEIVWCYTGPSNTKRWFPRKHDVLLFYCKSNEWQFNLDDVRVPYKALGGVGMFGSDNDFASVREEYIKKGKLIEDWWGDIPAGGGISSKERMGYPTQKPEALLDRIIRASSNEGDVVLDPFCGCGTTITVAQRLKRRWIGIDITHLAIGLMNRRLAAAFGEEVTATYRTIGEPTSLSDAEVLAAEDPFQFQAWALGLVGARVASSAKKGADKGIDGRRYFHDEPKGGKTKQVIFSVKAGHTSAAHLRDLHGVLTREQAEIGVLIAMHEPTRPMRTEAAGAGFYTAPWGTRHPKLQILTVAELLTGKGIDIPPNQTSRVRACLDI